MQVKTFGGTIYSACDVTHRITIKKRNVLTTYTFFNSQIFQTGKLKNIR